MRQNPVKAALKAGKPQIGTWLSFGNVHSTRLMARVGFPWLTVDLEHSPIDWSEAAVLFGAIADAGCVPLARVPRGDHDHIKRVLDAGAWGIVVPMVDTVEEAKTAIAAARYPPVGNRSLGGSLHAINFGTTAGEYYKRANDEILVVLQTESPRGVENAEAIYSLKGVDAIFVGPVDLTAQMRDANGNDPSPQAFEAMLQRVLAAGKKVGTPVGLHVQTVEAVQKRVAEGWQFLALGSELRMMVAEAQRLVTALDLKGGAGDLARLSISSGGRGSLPARGLFALFPKTPWQKDRIIPRLLLVFEFGTLNGGERSMLAVLPQFVGTDLEFVALAPAVGPLARLGALGIPLLGFEPRESSGERRAPPRLLEDIRSAAARVRPDLIHGNSLSMGRLTGQLAADLKVASTAHLRDIVGLTQRAIEQLNANRSLVAVSQAVRDFHVARGIDATRMHVVYNGVETERPDRDATGMSLRDELRLPPDAYLVATIGQICLRKGQDVFAKGVVLAAPQMPRAHFLMVGERYSEKTESALFEEALNFEFAMGGLKDRFHRLGYRSDVERMLPEIDLIVHCARQEPFGRVLLEAAAAERPIIATTAGGTAEMLTDGESAILVPPDQPDALAEAIVRLHDNAALSQQLAATARERVTAHFSIEHAARRLAVVWRGAL